MGIPADVQGQTAPAGKAPADGLGATHDERTRNLLEVLAGLRGARCRGCRAALCGHAVTMSVALGFKDAPYCPACLAAALGVAADTVREHAYDLINQQPCYRSGWEWASREEGWGETRRPPCLWPGAAPAPAVVPVAVPARPAPPVAAPPPVDAAWDAGTLSCGDLVLELRLRLRALRPRQVLQVTARDPAAPQDLPAWCALTGHALEFESHPDYWIRRKED